MRHLIVIAVLALAGSLTACDDPNSFRIDPLLQEDTLALAAPLVDSGVPTALDLAASQGFVRGRFPERVGDAEQWDLGIRRRGGELVFVPAGSLGLRGPLGGVSTAGVTRPLDRAFDEVREAPGRSSFVADSAVAIRAGSVYAARSRQTSGGFSACENYAKVQPLEVDAAAGRVRLRVVSNARCNDPRLVPEG